MDVRIEATPMTAGAEMPTVVIKVVTRFVTEAILANSQVASISCPSIAGTSISAVSPDNTYFGGTA